MPATARTRGSGPARLPLARPVPRTRLYPLGLRSLLGGAADEGSPVYLGRPCQ